MGNNNDICDTNNIKRYNYEKARTKNHRTA